VGGNVGLSNFFTLASLSANANIGCKMPDFVYRTLQSKRFSFANILSFTRLSIPGRTLSLMAGCVAVFLPPGNNDGSHPPTHVHALLADFICWASIYIPATNIDAYATRGCFDH
jgi:hypothetical protein